MSNSLIYCLPSNEEFGQHLAVLLGAEVGDLEARKFPDGESYLRFVTSPEEKSIGLVCTLNHPDEKMLSLLFAAATARELGAKKVGLIAPYLAYMRQDRRFHKGEAITSRHTARLLSGAFDWVATVDPHLHRFHALSEIYSIPARAMHAAPLLAVWVKANVSAPILIGPDAESEQWVQKTADMAGGLPFTVLEKTRHGDRDVEIAVRHIERLGDRTPVFIDDIVSSGRTMLEAVRMIARFSPVTPVCLAVHGLFAEGSDGLLEEAGARLVTTNTVPHRSNAIDVAPLLTPAVKALL